MKKTSICLIVALISFFKVTSNTFAQSFYDINTVQSISITFSQSNWDYMLDTAKAGSDGYIMAQSVTVNGTTFDSVGVKYKGNSTYNSSYVKNPFHIELDTYKDQDYQGYKDIKLSNVAKDPSFLREVVSYSILRKYMAAPLSNYANVSVNGNLIGLYVSSESINKTFVKKNFNSNDNTFFKCNPIDGAGPQSTALPSLIYLGNDSTSYLEAYELKSDYGWGDLISLTNILANNVSNIETVLDVDRALWMMAFDNVLVNLDSYIGAFKQNYYLYKDDNGRFNSVVWDLNESFGTFSMTGTINLSNTTAKKQMTHLLHSGDAGWPMVQKLLSIPAYKRMYIAHMKTILTENFSNNSYYTLAQSIQPVINASVLADPNKFFTYTQYQNNLTTDVSSGMTSAPGLTNLMGGRNTYLSALTDFTSTRPTITNVIPSDTLPVLNNVIYIKANVINTNTNAVTLGYRFSAYDKFVKTLMYDDGAHGDGAAGDNVYGASVTVAGDKIQYYVYAENNNAGIFSPARAEYEFYSVNVNTLNTTSILMNEIYARGTASNPDWVEIYNSSSSSADISGYKIYDNGGFSGTKPKKVFPAGSLIPAHGFLVIITDDADSSGFGLSNSGEKVWLENNSGDVIDTITYLAHTALQSYGRFHDGEVWQLFNYITRGTSNNIKLDLTIFIEGFYKSDIDMQVSDTINVELRNSVSPYAVADQTKGVVASDGTVQLVFGAAVTGNYYLSVSHRNSINTWSANALSISMGSNSYNFSTGSSQAFGNNLKEVVVLPAKFAIFGGDINQDGIVDAGDLSEAENDALNSVSGYVPADLTGDDFVDADDISLVENNKDLGVSVITP